MLLDAIAGAIAVLEARALVVDDAGSGGVRVHDAVIMANVVIEARLNLGETRGRRTRPIMSIAF